MISQQTYNIFKQASVTYFNASLFFPKKVKKDVFQLYAFVRTADDFVDQAKPDKKGFIKFKDDYYAKKSKIPVVKKYKQLEKRRGFKPEYTQAFLDAMESDFSPPKYTTIEDTIEYMYGSAEVIGLMLNRIMKLPEEADESAQLQGRAMQFANFIRDIDEDIRLQRSYFPKEDLDRFNLPDLKEKTAKQSPKKFKEFVNFEIERYYDWQDQASDGYSYIPKRLLIPIKTAADMYGWTISQIEKDPFVVYQKKIKPNRQRVFWQLFRNLFYNSQ